MINGVIGVVRKIDDLGRVVINKELRRALSLDEGDFVEMVVEPASSRIIMKKYEEEGQHCVFCGLLTNHTYMKRPLCLVCGEDISNHHS